MRNEASRKNISERFGSEIRAIRRLIEPPRDRMMGLRIPRAFSEHFDALSDKFDTLTGKIDTLTGKIDTLTGKIDGLSGKIDEITDRFDDEFRLLRRRIARVPMTPQGRDGRFADRFSRSFDEMAAKIDDVALRFEAEVREFQRHLGERPIGAKGAESLHFLKVAERFDDELRFLKTWIDNPLILGAVSPSSPFLARVMASFVEVERPGAVVELGPGTGAVTKALIERGIDPERIVAVEFDPEFCTLLARRFPGITVVEGDAYALRTTLGHQPAGPVAAVVSGLPLFNKPMTRRLQLLAQAFSLLQPGAPFVQFSYHLLPPIPREAGQFSLSGTRRIWRNIPPARVWCYRKTAA